MKIVAVEKFAKQAVWLPTDFISADNNSRKNLVDTFRTFFLPSFLPFPSSPTPPPLSPPLLQSCVCKQIKWQKRHVQLASNAHRSSRGAQATAANFLQWNYRHSPSCVARDRVNTFLSSAPNYCPQNQCEIRNGIFFIFFNISHQQNPKSVRRAVGYPKE